VAEIPVNPDDEFLELMALLREALVKIQQDRKEIHECAVIPSGPKKGLVPDPGTRAELRRLDKWIRRAKKVLS
jgi:hypothetical protein